MNDILVGVTTACLGVLVRACYAMCTDLFQRRYQVDDLQLPFGQAFLGAVARLYILPWASTLPAIVALPLNT